MEPSTDNYVHLNERYRSVVRSKILRRIYDKNLNLEQNDDVERIGLENYEKEDEDDERELDDRIAHKIKRQLTNEWRKTLERVLDHHGYLDSKLDASRKDALKFFLTFDWPSEERKRKPRQEQADLEGVIAERKSKIPWSDMTNKSDQALLLTNKFELNYPEYLTDSKLKHLGFRQIARLIRENLEHQFESLQPATLVERMAIRVARMNMDDSTTSVSRSQWYRLLAKALSWLRPIEDVELNNHRLMLSFSSIAINFTRHPLMTSEDRLVRQLISSFKAYRKSESQSLKLKHLDQQIVLLIKKIQDAQEVTAEVKMDVNLIQRLAEEKQTMVLERRKSLINLIQIWSNFQNQINDDSRQDLHQLDLKLDEIENIDSAQEKVELDKHVHQRIEIENLIKWVDTERVVNEEEIAQNSYLDDGRLPGEPKFTEIDLKLADYKYDHLNLFYYIEIYIDDKLVTTLEPKRLTQSFELTWTKTISYSLPFPFHYNAIVELKLPVLHLIEKPTLSSRNNTELAKVPLQAFPVWNQQEASKFELNFTNGEVKNKIKIEGWLEGSMRWSSLPVNANSESMSYYDEEKRKIKSLIEHEQIEQWLHDVRYRYQDQMRQIELMQLLFKQRYQLELESLYDKRQKEKNIERVQVKNELEDGSFCTDEDIETNQRFRLMRMRHEGHTLYRHHRFMPLTNTEVLLTEFNRSEPNKTSLELLLDFFRFSSETQVKRLRGEGQSEPVIISHEWCPEKNWYYIANRLLNQIRQYGHNLEHFDLEMSDNTDGLLVRREIFSRSEIVKEQPIDTLSSADFTLFQTFTLGQRKLNPSRKDRRKAAINILDAFDSDIQIVLVIQHASNVPFTVQDESNENYLSSSTFIEIKLDQNQTIATSLADGTQPTWNESFKLKIKLDTKQVVCLNLFARDSSGDEENGTVGDADRCWLGQLRIPLTLLLFNSKLEGTFRLTSPYFLRAYKSARKQTSLLWNRSIDSNEENDSTYTSKEKLANTVEQMKTLYSKNGELCSLLGSLPEISLSVFITTDPSIDSTINFMQENASLESLNVLDHCHRWQSSLQSNFPTRRFLCLVTNLQHKALLPIRFLSPIQPPSFDELNICNIDNLRISKKKTKANLKKLVHKESLYLSLIIRYVSLVAQAQEPSQLDAKQIGRWSKADLWMDVAQILTFRVCGQVEHAILLCCFLLYLNRKAALLIGTGLLDGPTAYVLLFPSSDEENETEPVIIDPKRGHQFLTRDYGITIISVDCVIATDNVYANIQKSTHPNRMSFHLHKLSHWQPLFGKKDSGKFEDLANKIQPSVVDFGAANCDFASNLEHKLEIQLREQLMNWRRQQTGSYTPINRVTTVAIKRILPMLEQHSCLVGHQFYATHLLNLEKEIVREFDQILDIHKLIGYPIHLSYRDSDQIAKLIHSTGIHQTHFGQPNSCEYVIAVHVQPYPAQVYSIWLYIGALAPKTIVS